VTHPFDEALRLEPDPDGRWIGATHPAYANMVGPFGGITAALMLQAALRHPARLGDPVTLTVNYAGPIADGAFRIQATPIRTNRATQHWTMLLTQGEQVATTATAVFGLRRDTWSATEAMMPAAPAPESLARYPGTGVAAWTERYDMRFARGPMLLAADAPEQPDSISELWLRDDPPRALDFPALAALCDVFFPRIMVRRPRRVPAGTVSLGIGFHVDAAGLAAQGDRALFGRARGSRFGLGYHDQTGHLWGVGGTLLASTHQIVYFKE
jgi:hypothetical protein